MTDLRTAISETAQAIASVSACCPHCGAAFLPYAVGGKTRRQRDALNFIRDYIATNDCSPSYDEIKDAMGLLSKSGVHRIVNGLVDRGLLEYMPGKKRSLCLPAREGI